MHLAGPAQHALALQPPAGWQQKAASLRGLLLEQWPQACLWGTHGGRTSPASEPSTTFCHNA